MNGQDFGHLLVGDDVGTLTSTFLEEASMTHQRYRLLSLDNSSSSAGGSPTALNHHVTTTTTLADPGDSTSRNICEETLEVTPSTMVKEIQASLERNTGKECSSVFCGGKRLHPESLAVCCHSRTLTFSGTENGFRVVEAASLQAIYDKCEGYRLNQVLRSLRDLNASFSKGSKAVRSSSGSGGVYFLKHAASGQLLACFKPRDDEPGARNNPNIKSMRDGVLPGEAAEREAAAFVLDWGGFCSVPGTLLVETACMLTGDNSSQTKIGSFQHFVQNAPDTAGDFSPHLFPPREVHKIGLLDIRFLNMDRNDSNILVIHRGDEYRLIPIDHGLCFPDRINVGWCDWVWWDWPQILLPFDQETCEWVMALDPMEDAKILRICFSIRPECIRLFICMTKLLKKCVAAGLTLHDIAGVVIRSRDIDEPSAMEKTVARAEELAALMEANAKVRTSPRKEKTTLNRSSSFDGNLSSASSLNGGGKSFPNEDVFFSYVDRLLEDVVAEIIQKKIDATNGSSSELDFDGSWFSLSTRSSPCELTKIASPRLMPGGTKGSSPYDHIRARLPSVPALNLQQ